ncbi:MAG: hypothetical protein ACOCYD_00455 [bacterium]
METTKTADSIVRYGWITKEEPLSCISDENLGLNIMILEAIAPFFSYYADDPKEEKPDHLYWVLDHFHPYETIFRAIETIRSKCYPALDATPGSISIANENYHVIRMHNLRRYNQIHAIEIMFADLGIKLKKSSRKINNQMGIIRLNKFLHFTPVEVGIYKENDRPHRAYFIIPQYVNWEDFKKVTAEVKYDTTLQFFDAARAAFMENKKITELVRIYRENLTLEQLLAIRDRYLKVLMQRYS